MLYTWIYNMYPYIYYISRYILYIRIYNYISGYIAKYSDIYYISSIVTHPILTEFLPKRHPIGSYILLKPLVPHCGLLVSAFMALIKLQPQCSLFILQPSLCNCSIPTLTHCSTNIL